MSLALQFAASDGFVTGLTARIDAIAGEVLDLIDLGCGERVVHVQRSS